MILYVQNQEDVLLNRVFQGLSDGFYIDVGANDPVVDSVTKLFYDRGWTGINVEPDENCWRRLDSSRPRDRNLNLGLSDRPGNAHLPHRQAGGRLVHLLVGPRRKTCSARASRFTPLRDRDDTRGDLLEVRRESLGRLPQDRCGKSRVRGDRRRRLEVLAAPGRAGGGQRRGAREPPCWRPTTGSPPSTD